MITVSPTSLTPKSHPEISPPNVSALCKYETTFSKEILQKLISEIFWKFILVPLGEKTFGVGYCHRSIFFFMKVIRGTVILLREYVLGNISGACNIVRISFIPL